MKDTTGRATYELESAAAILSRRYDEPYHAGCAIGPFTSPAAKRSGRMRSMKLPLAAKPRMSAP